MPERLFFFDTVSLANFALAGKMRLLVERYGQCAILTSEVLSEVENGISKGLEKLESIETLAAGRHLTLTQLTSSERQSKISLLRNLGSGEASCIACAIHRGGVVVTDDRAARAACKDFDIPVTGTIGIMLALVRAEKLSVNDADTVLLEMIRQGFYSPVNSISCLM